MQKGSLGYGQLGDRCEDIFTVLQHECQGETSLTYVEDSKDDQSRPCTPHRLQPLGMHSANVPISSGIYSAIDPRSSTSNTSPFQATFGHMSSVSRTRTRDKYFDNADFDDELD